MKSTQLLLVALLLLFARYGHAEGNCPPGYYPIGASAGQGGPQGCAPIPGDNSVTAPATLPPRWQDRWLAIAVDAPNGVLGTAVDAPTKNQAEQMAMSDCASKGGTQCLIHMSEANGCGALAAGKTGFNAQGAATLEEAKRLAMQICTSATSGCAVYYTACSPPVRVQ